MKRLKGFFAATFVSGLCMTPIALQECTRDPEPSHTPPANAVSQKTAPTGTTENSNEKCLNVQQEGAATIKGAIFYKGKEPKKSRIDMSKDAVCSSLHNEAVYTEEVVVDSHKEGDKESRTLRNVFIYVKKGLEGKKFETPKEPVVINQQGCMYHPHVFGIMVGQTLVIKNSDPTDHNIKSTPAKNQSFNEGQPKGTGDKEHTFKVEEVMVKFECNVHPWMNAYVGVLKHPYFAVTDEKGTFELKNLPPGTYEIEAWHEKLGRQKVTVKVGDKETQTKDFTFEGR